MHFDWFFHVLMIYWRTRAWVTPLLTIFASSLNKKNRFHVAVSLYHYKLLRTSKCAKNISVALNCT